MRNDFHAGTFITGLVFAGLGLAFVLEAAEVWTFEFRDLPILAPVIVIVVGIAVLASSLWGRRTR